MMKPLRYSIVLPVAAFYLYLSGSAPFLGQWDSYDYLKQIATHQLSALGIGRPVFVGYNILLWESAKKVFGLEPTKVEAVAMAGTVLLGVLGVILFQRLSRRFLQPPASRMAAVALALSPVYAVYSGFVMTEVPMLVALLASALVLWKPRPRHPDASDILGGILFGLAVGIREQALMLGAAFIWILCSRSRHGPSRLRSTALFGISAAAIILAPAAFFYFHDQTGFMERTRVWFRAIPTGGTQFRSNVQASVLYTLAVCPGAWFAAAGAGLYSAFRRWIIRGRPVAQGSTGGNLPALIPNPVLGTIACLVVPMAFLWRDADVQMHPRYLLAALPGSLIFCVCLYQRWFPSRRGPMIWAAVQILIFGLALAALSPYRQTQTGKMEFARMMRDAIPDKGLLIAGNLSPILDYYRGIGVRPRWQILWAGWEWNVRSAETAVRRAWADGIPVYLSKNPSGWSYFETEFLDLHFLLKDCRQEPVAPMLYRVYPARNE